MREKLKYIWVFVVLFWMFVGLPSVVEHYYGQELRNKTYWLLISVLFAYTPLMITKLARIPLIAFISLLSIMIYATVDVGYKVTRFFTDINEMSGYWYFISLAVVAYLVILLSRKRFNFDLLETVPYSKDHAIILAYRPPKRFIEYIGALVHYHPIGSYKIIRHGKELGFSCETGELEEKPFVPNGNWKYSVNEYNVDKVQSKIDQINKYHILKNSCYKLKRIME